MQVHPSVDDGTDVESGLRVEDEDELVSNHHGHVVLTVVGSAED